MISWLHSHHINLINISWNFRYIYGELRNWWIQRTARSIMCPRRMKNRLNQLCPSEVSWSGIIKKSDWINTVDKQGKFYY